MSSQEISDEVPPPLPARNSQRDSRGSPQVSPVQPSHPVLAESSSPKAAPAQPQEPERAAQPSQPMQPTHEQQVQNLFPTVVPVETIKTKRQELAEGDAHWQWKVGFRAVSIIVGLIGIGCAAWIVAHFTASSSEMDLYYYFDDGWSIPWTLITFTLSVVWSAVCIIVFFARRPNAPVHPGAQVGVDLILWLGFIITGSFAILGTISVAGWGSDGSLGWSGSGSGYYTMASNGTWVWHTSQYSSYYGEDRNCNATGSYQSRYGSDSYMFPSCADQDAYVNAVWNGKTLRYNIDLTATVCQFISLVLHFILFVWACVDTHYRNSRGVTKDAEKLAADIVMNMVKNGAIIPAPGQAHFPPMAQQGAPMGFMYPQQQYQPYPQQYPGQYPTTRSQEKAPVPQPQPQPQPAVASSSNEKSGGLRYA